MGASPNSVSFPRVWGEPCLGASRLQHMRYVLLGFPVWPTAFGSIFTRFPKARFGVFGSFWLM